MRSITIREAQHNLAKVLHQVEAGHTVEILRRKQPVARLVPAATSSGNPEQVSWDDHATRMASVWKGTIIAAVDEVLDEIREGR